MPLVTHQLARTPSTPQNQALRVRIILAAADGKANQRIARELGIPEITVSKWRRRFARHGLEGLRDAARLGRPRKYGPKVWERVQHRVCQQPPAQSRWSVRTLARELGLPNTTVHEILVASHLRPHRLRTFTFSPDPDFEAKLLDVVGLYLNPPDNALVLCVDEKTGIQALDRTQTLLPLSAKKPGAWTNEYVRHGTQTLLAALKIATREVVAQVRQRRTSANFLRFLDEVVAACPDLDLHLILDNLNIPKNQAAQEWLWRHPRVHYHYIPTHASWMNLIECFFSILTRQGLQQSVTVPSKNSKSTWNDSLSTITNPALLSFGRKAGINYKRSSRPPRNTRPPIPGHLDGLERRTIIQRTNRTMY